MSEQYWIRSCGKVLGPFSQEELQARARRGGFSRAHQVSCDKLAWQRATAFPELFPSPTTRRAPPIGQQPVEARDSNKEPLGLAEDLSPPPTIDLAPERESEYSVSGAPLSESSESLESDEMETASWYYSQNGAQYGPVSFPELRQMASMEHLAPSDLIWTEGMQGWTEAYRVSGIFMDPDAPAGMQGDTALEARASLSAEPLKTSPMAVGSFVLGLLGTTLLFFFGSIVAVVFGHVALRQIQASANTLGGRGMAIAGLIMGYTVIIATTTVGVVVICVYLMQGILAGPQ